MRLLRSKNFLKLTLPSALLIIITIYCLQTSNVFKAHQLFTSTVNVYDGQQKVNLESVNPSISSSLINNSDLVVQHKIRKDIYNVWCIFTKVTKNSPIRRKFRIFVNSLLRYTSSNVVLHAIVDTESDIIAKNVIKNAFIKNKKMIKVQYYNVQKLISQMQDMISVMSPHFSSKPGSYYSSALFFLSIGLHQIAPADQDVAVMLDADTKLTMDIKELFKEFSNFGKDCLFGLAPELTPVYRHVLNVYRNKHSKTIFGEADCLGGYSGYNSGVILLYLKRLRESLEYDQIVSRDSVDHMIDKYSFKGHLGDQDFYTLLGMERPELICKVDCGWNRQLCTWWKDRGYADVFDNYARCNSKTKIWHGNCNTPIPDND